MEPRQLSRVPPFRKERGKDGAPSVVSDLDLQFVMGGPPASERPTQAKERLEWATGAELVTR
jgi:hypothetical protein